MTYNPKGVSFSIYVNNLGNPSDLWYCKHFSQNLMQWLNVYITIIFFIFIMILYCYNDPAIYDFTENKNKNIYIYIYIFSRISHLPPKNP